MTKILDNDGFVKDICLFDDLTRDIKRNNTYCPDIIRVIYNIGTKTYPVLDENGKRIKDENGNFKYGAPVNVLTTVVFFKDGTKVSVTNSEHDGVKFIEQKVAKADGAPTVLTADNASKEAGLVYAIAKRMIGKIGKNGKIDGDGFGRKLHDVIDFAYDTAFEAARNKYNKAEAKKAYEAKKGTAKPKRPSFADTVVDLRAAVDGMKEMIDVLKADLASIKAAQ